MVDRRGGCYRPSRSTRFRNDCYFNQKNKIGYIIMFNTTRRKVYKERVVVKKKPLNSFINK